MHEITWASYSLSQWEKVGEMGYNNQIISYTFLIPPKVQLTTLKYGKTALL
jgi:hypothetical protein